MSNIIRSYPSSKLEKKIIHTKKIENKAFQIEVPELDPVQQKQSLLQEIESLKSQHENVKNQIKLDQQQAKADMEAWRETQREQAEIEARNLAEQASAQGFQSGFDAGMKQAEEEYREKRAHMQELIEQAYEEKTKIIGQSEPFLLSLSVRIAEKVIKKELKQHDDQLLNIVQRALKILKSPKMW